MAAPSPFKISKNGVELVSYIDLAKYNMAELSRRALTDTGKYLRMELIKKIKTLPGMKRHKRPYSAVRWSVPRWKKGAYPKLEIGIKHGTWYGEFQEFGTRSMKKKGWLRGTTEENLAMIRFFEGFYLKEIEDNIKAQALIEESDMQNAEGEERV